MSDDVDRCPCGTPRESAYYWHQTSQCGCMHHDGLLCFDCTASRLAKQLVSEVEQHLSEVA